MSITLFVERTGEQEISAQEWRQLVARHADLRMAEAASDANPRTGAFIQVRAEEAISEINIQGTWLGFLSWRRGKLVGRYREEFEDAQNPVRRRIVQVARELNAMVFSDVEDEPLRWLS